MPPVIARYVEAVIVVLWAHRNREKNRYLEGAYRGFGIPVSELKTVLIKGLPLMFNEVLWAAGTTTTQVNTESNKNVTIVFPPERSVKYDA